MGASQRHFPRGILSPAATVFRPVRPVTHNTQMTGTGLYCGGLVSPACLAATERADDLLSLAFVTDLVDG